MRIRLEGTPVAFYFYDSWVQERILSIEYSSKDELHQMKSMLIELFNKCGIKCQNDNKITFEFEHEGKRVFYGFADWKFTIGFSVKWKYRSTKENSFEEKRR